MCGMTNAEKIFSVNGRISDFFIDISLRSVVLLVVRRTTTTTRTEGFIMTKRKIGLAIGLAVTCIAALCATGACNGIGKEESNRQPHPAPTQKRAENKLGSCDIWVSLS